VPARTTRRSPGAVEVGSGPLQTHNPHSGQTHRVTVRPLSAMRWIGRGRAPERMNASVSMTTPIENALPVSLALGAVTGVDQAGGKGDLVPECAALAASGQ
jgi:hypothetical protein